jgi:predicted porin
MREFDHEDGRTFSSKQTSWEAAARYGLISAAIVLGIATAAHAEGLSDTKTDTEKLRAQNRTLTKKVDDLETRLRKLEAQPAKQRATASQPAAKSTAANVTKAPSLVADDGSLTWHGVTLYGAVDVGVGYNSRTAPLSTNAGFGINYLISKNSSHPYFGVAPNALSSSNIGLKGKEDLSPDLAVIFNLQTSFLPTSGRLADGLGSLVQDNGVALANQTTSADSSKDGQFLNTAAWAGVYAPTYGQVTFGRQNSLTLDGVVAYDPMSGSGAFSVIGFQGTTAGMGDTENARLDNSIKYVLQAGPFRAATAAQLSPDGSGTRNIVEGQIGFDYLGASFDAIYSHVNDAISAASLPVGFTPTAGQLASAGQGLVAGTISDNTSLMLLAQDKIGPVRLYAGYENIVFANPSTGLPVGTDILGGYTLGTVNNTDFPSKKDLQVFWTGAKYAVRSDIDLMIAYYHEQQNSYGTVSCSDDSLATCRGQLDAVSLVADYRFAKRFDAYIGAMYSEVSNGLANGFLHRTNIDPTAGMRFQF